VKGMEKYKTSYIDMNVIPALKQKAHAFILNLLNNMSGIIMIS